MGRILDGEFRKELYKSLVEAGYEKQEAQKIVGVKYFKELKETVNTTLGEVVQSIDADEFNPLTTEWFEMMNANIAELQKMKEYLN